MNFDAPPLPSWAFETEEVDAANAKDKLRCVIFHGYPEKAGACSNLAVAKTLEKHLAKRFPSDQIDIVCAWHKNVFLATLFAQSKPLIRQIHYCGHGSGGTLSFGYNHPDFVSFRTDLADALDQLTLSEDLKAAMTMSGESTLVSGLFESAFAGGPAMAALIKGNLAPNALMHVWGCFAGAATHTFTDRYWERLNLGQSSVDGVALHIAKSLGISVTAARDSVHGMNYTHRDKKGKLHDNKRPCAEPHWMWPSRKKVQWVTYDALGKANVNAINFLGSTKNPKKIKGAKHPPAWFLDEIPLGVKAIAAPTCSATGVFTP